LSLGVGWAWRLQTAATDGGDSAVGRGVGVVGSFIGRVASHPMVCGFSKRLAGDPIDVLRHE